MKLPNLLKQTITENKKTLIISVFLVILISVFDLYFSLLLKDAIDAIASVDPELLKQCALKSAGLILGYGLTYKLYCTMRNKFVFSSICEYREKIFSRIMRQNYETFHQRSSGEYLAMLSTNMETVKEEALEPICRIVSLTVTGLGALIIMLSYNWILTILALTVAIIPIYVSYRTGKPLASLNQQVSDEQSKLVEQIQNELDNHKDILIARQFEFAASLYKKVIIKLERSALKKRECIQTMSWIGALNALISQLGICCAGGFSTISSISKLWLLIYDSFDIL